MMAAKTVTFALPKGTKVQCGPELAASLGYTEPKPKAPRKSKSE